jgi:tetratricopeptide (TPR) repeat protein
VSRARRRALLYTVALAAAAGLLFAGYGITLPPDAATRLNGAAFLAGLGQIDQALADCDAVLREHPGHPDALVFRATFLAQAGRDEQAAAAYEEAIAHATGDMRCDLVLDRASVLLRAGRDEEFRRERARLVAWGAGHRIDVWEGLLGEKERDYGRAAAAYGRALKQHPRDEHIRGRLYGSLLERGRQELAAGRFDTAGAAFDEAALALPGAHEAELRSAEVRLATGHLDGAIERLRAVGRNAPGVAPLVFRAATLLLEAGRRDEALDALVAALGADDAATRLLLQNETAWRDALSQPDVREILDAEQRSTGRALTADGGVIDQRRDSGEPGASR